MTLLWTERRSSPSSDERDTTDDNPAKDHDDNDDKDSVIGASTSSVTTKQHVKEVPLSWLQSTREELEQERTKRRQLEEQIAQLQQQQQQPAASTRSSQRKRTSTSHKSSNHGVVATPGPSYQQMVDLQAQVHGYQQIVDALTAGRPAIDFAVRLSVSSAARASSSSDASLSSSTSRLVNPYQPLPLHVVRFLEFMPWHPQAMQAAMETEQVLEWQVYCSDKNQWKSELKFFPTFFQALPVIVTGKEATTTKAPSTSTSTASHASSINLAGVWTNQNLTLRLDLTRGCALANNKLGAPTWKWLEDWQVTTANQIKGEHQEEEGEDEEDHETIMAQYLDQDGWSYATEASHFLLAETSSLPSHYLIDPSSLPPHVLTNESSSVSTRSGNAKTGSPRTLSLVRRRTWTRRRVLVDYPYACETTVHFLRLLAETRELEVTNQQLQASYQEARLNLANMELRHVHCHRHWVQETATLRARLERAEQEHLELLERRRGPPLTRFVPLLPNLTTTTTTVAEQDQQGQHAEEEDVTLSCPLNLRHESILLNPENGPMSCKATANDHANTGSSNPTKGLSFFGWGGNNHNNNNNNKDDRKRASSPAPDVEPCSDCNSIASCEDHDISERSGEDDLSLERFASSPPTEERHKSFLELWFVGKHPTLGGGGGDKKAVTTNHLDIENF